MASLKIKYLRGAITLFALCLIGTATAATNGNGNEKEEVKAKTEKTIAPTTWHFTGTSLSEVFNEDMWQSADPGESGCSSAPDPLPCSYTVSDEDIADTEELITYLRATHQDNPSAVAPAADSRKAEE